MNLVIGRTYTLTSNDDRYVYCGDMEGGHNVRIVGEGNAERALEQIKENGELIKGTVAWNDTFPFTKQELIDRIKKFDRWIELEAEEL